MNAKNILTGLAFALCLGSVSAVMLQRQQLLNVRSPQNPQAKGPDTAAKPDNVAGQGSVTASSREEALSELLKLRNEVTRLSARKRELSGVVGESEQLRQQLATNQANISAENRLPPGYIRKAQAQMVGYSTPEDTVQSFLWALQHHDPAGLLRSLTPAQAQALGPRFNTDPNAEHSFFKDADVLPGLAILSRRNLPNGSVELQVTLGANTPAQTFRLQPINGEWKLDETGL